MALEHYVKFVRGTYDAYSKVTSKDDDTLYFIYNEDTNESALYLGSRKIASAEGDTISESSINALADVLISEGLTDKSLLVYNAEQQQWINTDFEKLVFVGATDTANGVAGFVPAPAIKETNLFLRSDGTWAAIEGVSAEVAEQNVINITNESNKTHADIIAEAVVDLKLAKGNIIIIKDLIIDDIYEHSAYVYDGTEWVALNSGYKANKIFFTEDLNNISAQGQDLVEVLKSIISNLSLNADNTSISLVDNKLSLKDYGTQYYKYVPESGSEEDGDYIAAHYELQIVDENNPWISGLEPRVTSEDGQLVLGWYEQNPTTIDGVNAQVSSLQTSVNDLQQSTNELLDLVGAPAEGEVAASGLYAELDTKANAEDVYTKEEVNAQIAAANHLKRKIVSKYEDIQTYIDENDDADQYIFMVPIGVTDYDNKYNEYIVIEGAIEPVGDWSVDLNDYVTETEFNTALVSKVDKVDGGHLFMQADATKLASIEDGAQVNKIDTVDEAHFSLSNKHLSLLDIPITKVTNLETILNGKVDKKDGYRLMSEAEATKLATAEENYISSVDETQFTVTSKKLSLLDIPITKVTNLETILNSKADKSDIAAVNTNMTTLNSRVATVEAAIQWVDLSTI